MTRRAGLTVFLLSAAGLAPGAAAQSGGSAVLFSLGLGKPLAQRTVPAQVSGQLVVSFHGDGATGCASRGLCGYSGTVIFRPGPSAQLLIDTVQTRHGRAYEAGAFFSSAVTGAEVSRRGASGQSGRCADEQQPDAFLAGVVEHGVVRLSLLQPGGSLLLTRCAGPLDSDLAAASPSATIALSQLLMGHQNLDLSGTTQFAADGLAGSVSSTLQLRLGKPSRPRSLSGGLPKRIKRKRVRFVTERLTVTQATGHLQATIRATSDPAACPLLDSCGFAGTLTDALSAAAPTAQLIAIGPANLPYSRFQAALRGQRVPGIALTGLVNWSQGGTLTDALSGPGESCQDTAPGPGASVILQGAKNNLVLDYLPAGPLRGRCPGPLIGGASAPLISGHLPRGILRHHAFVLALRGSGAASDDGYTAAVTGAVRIGLRRGPISQRVLRVPSG